MLYKLATGARAFEGHSSAETLAAVLAAHRATDADHRRATGAGAGDSAVSAQGADRRYQAMLDVRNDLQELEGETAADFRDGRPGRGVG